MTAGTGISRRDFLQKSAAGAAALGAGAWAANALRAEPVEGDPAPGGTIGVGVIGCGGQGTGYHLRRLLELAKEGKEKLQVRAVCDIYEPRKKHAMEITGAEGCHDYRDLLKRLDVHAVHICTPDHWHFQMSKDALEAGKDVYCEKPVTYTWEEAKELKAIVQKSKRLFQCGVNTTSNGIWWKAQELIQAGLVGKLVWSQASYSRNSKDGEWNYPIDADAKPGVNLDWDAFLGTAPKIPWNPDHFFRWRKYWAYSGGIATDLFFHQLGHLAIALGPGEFPARVVAAGGICCQPDRDVPDTYITAIDYPSRHSVVLGASMANHVGLDETIRGHEAALFFKGGKAVARPEPVFKDEWKEKWKGHKDYREEGDDIRLEVKPDWDYDHVESFYRCVRSRKPTNNPIEHAYPVMVAIHLGVLAYRHNRVMRFDPEKEKLV